MKGLYRADAVNRTFVSSDVVDDDYQLKDNETFEDPSGKVMPAKLQVKGGPWIDATEEEHKAYMEAQQKEWESRYPQMQVPQEPDKSDQAVNLLGQQIAQMKQQQNTTLQSINALGQQIAKSQTASAPTQA